AQERMWLLEELSQGAGEYTIGRAWRLRGPLDPDLLERSLAVLTDRHEVLRASFAEDGGRLVQRIAPSVDVALTRVDLTGRPGAGPRPCRRSRCATGTGRAGSETGCGLPSSSGSSTTGARACAGWRRWTWPRTVRVPPSVRDAAAPSGSPSRSPWATPSGR